MEFSSIAGYISEWMGVIAVAWLFSLGKRFQRPPIGFVYARRDGLVALSLYAVALVFAVLFTVFNPPGLMEPLPFAPAPVTGLSNTLIMAGITLLPFIAALFTRKQPAKSAGWNPETLSINLQLGIAMALLTIFLRNRVMDVLRGVDQESLVALLLAIGVAFAEETIFRGYLQLRLGWWLGAWRGILLTSALFTVWHLPAWVRTLPADTILILSAMTFAQGLVLGWIMRKSGHVAAPALYRSISIWITWMG